MATPRAPDQVRHAARAHAHRPFGARERVGLDRRGALFQAAAGGRASGRRAAAKAGLRTFDVVTAIHGRPVATSTTRRRCFTRAARACSSSPIFARSRRGARLRAAVAAVPRSAQVVPQQRARRRASRRTTTPGSAPPTLRPHRRARHAGLAPGRSGCGPATCSRSSTACRSPRGSCSTQTLDEHPDRRAHARLARRRRAERRSSATAELPARSPPLLDEYQAESTYYVFGAEGARAIAPVPDAAARAQRHRRGARGRRARTGDRHARARARPDADRPLPSTSIGGPILVYEVAGVAAQHGFDHFLAVAALVSLNLGLSNLLPVPLLDGGQASLVFIEAVRRRPVSHRARERATFIGLALLGRALAAGLAQRSGAPLFRGCGSDLLAARHLDVEPPASLCARRQVIAERRAGRHHALGAAAGAGRRGVRRGRPRAAPTSTRSPAAPGRARSPGCASAWHCQGLCFALGKPLVMISSLAALAARAPDGAWLRDARRLQERGLRRRSSRRAPACRRSHGEESVLPPAQLAAELVDHVAAVVVGRRRTKISRALAGLTCSTRKRARARRTWPGSPPHASARGDLRRCWRRRLRLHPPLRSGELSVKQHRR